MAEPIKIDKQAHLAHLNQAMNDLSLLAPTTGGKASEAVQFVGTIIENTLCLLTAPANALDRGNRLCWFDEDKNWLSVMGAMHRSFFSAIHTATERALSVICANESLDVKISTKQRVERFASEIKDKLNAKQVKELLGFAPKFPSFTDYLEAVLKASAMPDVRKKFWREHFKVLGIVRNKASHAHVALSDHELSILKESKFQAALSGNDILFNVLMYKLVCIDIIQFFKELGHGDNQ